VRSAPLLIAALFSYAVSARAQVEEHPRFPAERLQLATDRNGLVDVEWAEPIARGTLEAYGWAGWAHRPLVVRRLSSGERIGDLVRDRSGGELGLSWAPLRSLQLSLAMPFILSQGRPSDQPRIATVAMPELAHSGPGDLRLAAKIPLLRQDEAGLSMALIPAVSFPSGGSKAYRGEGGLALLPKVAVGWKHESGLRLGVNLGGVIRRTERVLDQTAGTELTFGAGAGFRYRRLELAASLSGAMAAARPLARANEDALEARALVAVRLGRHLDVFGGGGLGLLIGWGTPDYRAFLGIRTPFGDGEQAARPPSPPEPAVAAAPPPPPTPAATELGAAAPPEPAEPPPPPPPPEPVVAPAPAPTPAPVPPPLARLGSDRIEILGEIRFATDSDVIVRASLPVLDGVVALLRGHPEIGRLRIEGHTDDRGSAAHNLDLSRRRAAAAVLYLVAAGIDADRLESIGLGAARPVGSNVTSAGRARNRRLEFVIIAARSAP
jgi:outer membrane protein OmpA-like peptidoglycan-associated protein